VRQNCISPREQAARRLQPSAFVAQTLSPRWPSFQLARPPVVDVNLSKAFVIRERLHFWIFARAFNVGKTSGFGAIDANATSPAFGTLSPTQGNLARRIEIVGKLTW
jgi:hypothetical protein